jgi:hypothetical protein
MSGNPNQVIDDRIYYFSGGSLHSENLEGGGIQPHSEDELKDILEDVQVGNLNDGFIEEIKENTSLDIEEYN